MIWVIIRVCLGLVFKFELSTIYPSGNVKQIVYTQIQSSGKKPKLETEMCTCFICEWYVHTHVAGKDKRGVSIEFWTLHDQEEEERSVWGTEKN